MSEPAFFVQGVGITAEQRDAALAAMNGRFTTRDIHKALRDAGVPQASDAVPHSRVSWCWVPERAADRLLQSERKAKRIRCVKTGTWERIA